MWDLVWPTECAGCDARGEGRLCPSCAPGEPFRVALASELVTGALAVEEYDAPLGRALRRAKYAPDRGLFVELSGVFGRRLGPMVPSRTGAIVPVPSTARNRWRRGYAPGALLAAGLERETRLPVADVLRLRGGAHQAALGRGERRRNAAGRFTAIRAVPEDVLLVDDVVTTGSTADACALALLCAGARRVRLATLCATRRREVATPGRHW